MKKIISLALAAGMLVSASIEAKAADISAFGLFRVTGEVLDNTGLVGEADLDPSFLVHERIEFGVNVKVSDEVMGQFRFRAPNSATWDSSETTQVSVRTAFIKFPLASLTAVVGYQLPSLPSLASGSNIIANGTGSLPGIALVGNFGMVTPSLSWYIAEAPNGGGTLDNPTYGKVDSYSLVLPVALADGMTLTPWANAIVTTGWDSNSTRTTLGASFDAAISNINAGAGVVYAMSSIENQDASLIVAANVAMDLGALTPGVAVWYGLQGDNALVTSAYNNWGGFNGANDTTFGNGSGLNDGLDGLTGELNPFNTLGVQVNVADIALGDKMGLGAHVLYMMDVVSETTSDSGLEIGAVFNAEIAQGLGLAVDANYVMPMGDWADNKGNGFGVAATLDMAF